MVYGSEIYGRGVGFLRYLVGNRSFQARKWQIILDIRKKVRIFAIWEMFKRHVNAENGCFSAVFSVNYNF